jgi:hypothetical protein
MMHRRHNNNNQTTSEAHIELEPAEKKQINVVPFHSSNVSNYASNYSAATRVEFSDSKSKLSSIAS